MVRVVWPIEQVESGIQITTVNASSSIDCLRDAFAELPDIILVQESPSKENIESLIEEIEGYEYIFGYDTSIIARGQLVEGQKNTFYTSGTAIIDSEEYFIVSLRLLTTDPRLDLWKWDCWASQSARRNRQMEQMKEIVHLLPNDPILVIGGDFNVSQRDKVFALLEERTDDTFIGSGRGWCNTILSDTPLLRIDQIWVSDRLSSYHSYARVSPKTDHRLYTSKLKWSQRD